jgi:DNA-binding NtrC family response regulator
MSIEERESSQGNKLLSNQTESLPTAELGAIAPIERAPKRRVLLLVYHRDGMETAPLLPGSSVVVGRQPPSDLVIADKALSSRHARFTLVAADEVTVEDLGSTNGTRVGGRRVERATVKPGEEVMLGSIAASVHVIASAEAPSLGLDGHDAFRAAVEAEIVRARCFGRTLSVMMVHADKPKEGHLARFCPRVRKLLRPVDRVGLYSADILEILLPELDEKQALELGRAIAGRQDGEPPLVCGVATFPGAASSGEELIEVSRGAARRATFEKPVQAAASEVERTLSRGEDARAAAPDDRLVIDSPAMRAVEKTATRLAQSTISVLLQGETGTGKEVVARFIHESGPRRNKPLICVNCGAIPATLVESTFFGQEKGSYSGAIDKRGVFEAASGGSVFLDEIGELALAAQVALLRVLETKRVTRVGSTREIEVDVRVIAATHRDLEAMVETGTFRADLLNRLNTFELGIPPLRERREEIAPLAARFLRKAVEANGREERMVRVIDPEAMALLDRYAWPGNVRELRNAIERAVVIAEGDTILAQDLPERIRAAKGPGRAFASEGSVARQSGPIHSPVPEGGASYQPGPSRSRSPEASVPRPTGSLKVRIESFEKDTIIEALQEAHGNQTAAARLLEVPLRTLQHKIQAHGIRRGGYGAG